MYQDWINALIGGVIIGIAVSLMLLLNGRVTGISGILGGLLGGLLGGTNRARGDTSWRLLFIAGLVLGGLALKLVGSNVFPSDQLALRNGVDTVTTVIAGLLVGFGTLLGSGCTSGHGVCGISRLSLRSIVATITFIVAGVLAVAIFKLTGVLT